MSVFCVLHTVAYSLTETIVAIKPKYAVRQIIAGQNISQNLTNHSNVFDALFVMHLFGHCRELQTPIAIFAQHFGDVTEQNHSNTTVHVVGEPRLSEAEENVSFFILIREC